MPNHHPKWQGAYIKKQGVSIVILFHITRKWARPKMKIGASVVNQSVTNNLHFISDSTKMG